MTRSIRAAAPSLAVLLALSACARGDEQDHPKQPAHESTSPVPLYDNLGTLHHAITASPDAQRYFDQGLRLTYAFNHEEAIASFKEGARRDPNCAMCWWGAALAMGPNINLPMEESAEPEAYQAAQKAVSLASKVAPAEQEYIAAVSQRYHAAAGTGRADLDTAYAVAMHQLTTDHAEDVDAATLYAESLMDLQPWSYWTQGGKPKGRIQEIVTTLESVIARQPDHPGACHYYIHAVESSLEPEKGLPCAERLAALMPGAGHLVHMPAHIYMRVGRYADAIRHNEHAVTVDHELIDQRHLTGPYPLLYLTHNYHFLWAALTMQGRADEAIKAARNAVAQVPPEILRQLPPVEFVAPTPLYALARFGKWDELLHEPAPPTDLKYTTGMWHYTRGLALAATGKLAEAHAESDSTAAIAAAMPPDRIVSLNSARSLLQIADHHLAAEIALKEHKGDEAARRLNAAIKLEDDLNYDEPPAWYYPVRQALGAALLASGKPAQAEQAYREDLRRNRENGWSLRGLAESLAKQGKKAEASDAEARFHRAWESPGPPAPGT